MFALCAAVQTAYTLAFWLVQGKWAVPHGEENMGQRKEVSVIICARNEAAALAKGLPAILAQNYTLRAGQPGFEVVVVDDRSTDNTPAVLAAFADAHPHLRTVRVEAAGPPAVPGKKAALLQGLRTARHSHLLLTDADCVPRSPDWISGMTAPLSSGKSIAAGYGALRPAPGLLNLFARWETLHTFLQYRAWARLGSPYMAVGRNLATTRASMEMATATAAWRSLPSGDDDLLVRAVATKRNYTVVSAPDAFTYSNAKRTVKDYLRQKQRHLSTGKLYRPGIRTLLGIYGGAHTGCWVGLPVALGLGAPGWVFGIFAARCVLLWALYGVTAARLREPGILIAAPLLDAGWAVYNFALAPYIFWRSKRQWT